MKKIDFHIHTISTNKESEFTFDLEKLKNYINEKELDIIAITNHNTFDKIQYELISENVNAIVFPGMEVDIENAHMLVITDEKDIEELENASVKLQSLIKSEEDSISYDEFITIFPKYKYHILIPHYEKKPKMSASTIKKFSGIIKCGEVPNFKRFLNVIKNKSKLIPVVFSDYRDYDKVEFPNRYTYIDVTNCGFSNIKCALEDRNKVSVTKKNNNTEIEYLPDGSTISNKLNVILGTRTSGKTYNIEKIRSAFDDDNCLYIPQFSLTGEAENKEFSRLIKKECASISEEFYEKFKLLVNKIITFDIKEEENTLEERLDELVEYAKNENSDVYSSTPIFSEINFAINSEDKGKNVILSLKQIYETEWNKETIEKYIDFENIKKLLSILITKRKSEKKIETIKQYTNKIIEKIKLDLTIESALIAPKSMDIISFFKHKKIIEKTNALFAKIKTERTIESRKLSIFDVCLKSEEYKNATEIKDSIKTQKSLKDIYHSYYKENNLYKYVWQLKEQEFQISDICRALVNIKYEVKNAIGEDPSGGEKAEFNLLKEIDNASKFDILLIDEPEASFDNLFINENIVEIIKKISEKTTVCITTHNSTLAMMLNPNKIIFTENKKGRHKVYYGAMGDKVFKSTSGDEIISYDNIMDVLEAGKDIYMEKGRKYESFKN